MHIHDSTRRGARILKSAMLHCNRNVIYRITDCLVDVTKIFTIIRHNTPYKFVRAILRLRYDFQTHASIYASRYCTFSIGAIAQMPLTSEKTRTKKREPEKMALPFHRFLSFNKRTTCKNSHYKNAIFTLKRIKQMYILVTFPIFPLLTHSLPRVTYV